MNEKQRKKHIREPPSIPFIWEAKPGIPKKDWKPVASSLSQSLPKTPLKQIASVPFVWEEKPGKPLHNFSHVSVNESESITSLDLESFSFENDESVSLVPSLLANCLVSSTKVSSAIPLQQNSLYVSSSPASSETDCSISSYETGMSSLTGSAFLECLFPLFPPKSGFLERNNTGHTEKDIKINDFEHEDYTCVISRKPPTLGELIMMSRRRSCRNKASLMNKWDPPKKTTRKQAIGCFTFVTSRITIEGLLKRKYYPRLKLI